VSENEMDVRDMDKRTADFSLRIPEITKTYIDKLPASMKRDLNDRIILLMDRVIHEASYTPGRYLKSEN